MTKEDIRRLVRLARIEDVGSGDITSRLAVPSDVKVKAVILTREKALICGMDIAREVFRQIDPAVVFSPLVYDGEWVEAGTQLVALEGAARSVLTAERVALNFLTYLSAIATRTRRYCDQVCSFKVKILDTRKTTPGLRQLERYAVRCGGGENHRFGLFDMVLVKDNHRFVSREKESLDQTVRRMRVRTNKKIEVEVDTLAELEEVLLGGPDIVLLDNMSLVDMRKAVKMVHQLAVAKRPLLEASGGITLRNIRQVAATGVDRISVGALTHSREAVDLSMEFMK